MDQKTDRFYPSAALENNDSEQRLKKKLKDVNAFNNHINNIKELITYFKDKNYKSVKKYKKYEMITPILKCFETFVFIAPASSSIALSLTGIGLIAIPLSTAGACGLLIGNKVLYEIIIKNTTITKHNKKKNKKQVNILINYTGNTYRIM